MTRSEAERFLVDFLATEARVLDEVARAKARAGQAFAVNREHLITYFADYDPAFRPGYRDWADRLPEALKAVPAHQRGEQVFDDAARSCFLRMGYFFGECLVREFPRLSWGTGDTRHAHAGRPVVRGFTHGRECPAIHVCMTVGGRIDHAGLGLGEFLATLDVWRGNAAA